MFLISVFLVSVLMIFVNALFYTISLLIFSFLVLLWIVSSNFMSTLMIILVVVVYIGAMIILIGYICAVSPNLITTPSFRYLSLVFLLILVSFLSRGLNFNCGFESFKSGTLLDFFFRDWGVSIFLTMIFMLFFTLLIVTSQYSSPQGPFRSN